MSSRNFGLQQASSQMVSKLREPMRRQKPEMSTGKFWRDLNVSKRAWLATRRSRFARWLARMGTKLIVLAARIEPKIDDWEQ